jgi:hypothetical protein
MGRQHLLCIFTAFIRDLLNSQHYLISGDGRVTMVSEVAAAILPNIEKFLFRTIRDSDIELAPLMLFQGLHALGITVCCLPAAHTIMTEAL